MGVHKKECCVFCSKESTKKSWQLCWYKHHDDGEGNALLLQIPKRPPAVATRFNKLTGHMIENERKRPSLNVTSAKPFLKNRFLLSRHSLRVLKKRRKSFNGRVLHEHRSYTVTSLSHVQQ